MLLGLIPLAVGVAAALFAVVVWATRYVSLGSILAAVSLPLTLLAEQKMTGEAVPPPIWVFALVVPFFIVWTHRANVRRLLDGTESQIGGAA